MNEFQEQDKKLEQAFEDLYKILLITKQIPQSGDAEIDGFLKHLCQNFFMTGGFVGSQLLSATTNDNKFQFSVN